MPKMEIDRNGLKTWCNSKGQFHRLNGPALERADGFKCWYIKGKNHRTDGPAVELSDGSKYWFIDGEHYSFDEWLNKLQVSDEEKIMLCLKWK